MGPVPRSPPGGSETVIEIAVVALIAGLAVLGQVQAAHSKKLAAQLVAAEAGR